MLVLADIEWALPQGAKPYPTQLALQRVDDAWNTAAIFYSRIRPGATPPDWSFCAFSGGSAEEFLSAPFRPEVEDKLCSWLQEDDLLCWWFAQSKWMFRRFFPTLKRHASITVTDYLPEYFQDSSWQERNPYVLAGELLNAFSNGKNYGAGEDWATLPGPEHFSLNDTKAMRMALSAMQFPQKRFLKPPTVSDGAIKGKHAQKSGGTGSDGQFLYDPSANMIHKKGCPLIADEAQLLPYGSLKVPMQRGYQPCPKCCAKEYRGALVKRNADILRRCQYTYIYAPGSSVFHKYTCKTMLSAHGILGTGKYSSCVEKGMRPCKLCRPTKDDPPNPTTVAAPPPPSKARPAKKPRPGNLPKEKQRAVSRLWQAQQERFDPRNKEKLSSDSKDDFYTLTQPGFVFWAARGYQNFHTRNCPKLKGLSALTGFARYSDALHAGYTPCKQCKPSKKQDMVYSIPITSRKRSGESYRLLFDLCREHHYPCSLDDDGTYFLMETPVGKWKINLSANPVSLEHINLSTPWGSKTQYHQQPRLFLSLSDTFSYIHRHDSVIMRRLGMDDRIEDTAAEN